MFPLSRVPFWHRFFEPRPNGPFLKGKIALEVGGRLLAAPSPLISVPSSVQ